MVRYLKQSKKYARLAVIPLTIVFSYFLFHTFSPLLYNPQILTLIHNNGAIEFALLPILYISSRVILFLPDFPLNLLGIDVFGPANTVFIVYCLGLVAASIEFFLARKFGDKMLKFILRGRGARLIYAYTDRLGTQDLAIGRLFGVYLFDPISYISGFTKIEYKSFILTTAVFQLPYYVFFFLIANSTNDVGKIYLFDLFVRYGLLTIFFVYYWKLKRKK